MLNIVKRLYLYIYIYIYIDDIACYVYKYRVLIVSVRVYISKFVHVGVWVYISKFVHIGVSIYIYIYISLFKLISCMFIAYMRNWLSLYVCAILTYMFIYKGHSMNKENFAHGIGNRKHSL